MLIAILYFISSIASASKETVDSLYDNGKFNQAYLLAQELVLINDRAAQRVIGLTMLDMIEKGTNDKQFSRTLTPLIEGTAIDKAQYWLKKSSNQGDINSMVALGELYAYYAEKKDYELAYHYFRKAHEANSARGTYHLGLFYLKQLGVKRDLKKAFKLFKLASEQGDFESMRLIGDFFHYGYLDEIDSHGYKNE